MDDVSWLLITYKIPPEPAAKRMAVWRKLKGMGAIYLQGGVCLVPKTDDALRRLKVIENDIGKADGSCVILETTGLDRTQQEKVVARFKADRDDAYEEFLDKCDDFEREVAKEVDASHFTFAELEENEADLTKLRNWLGKIRALDFYGAELGPRADARLQECAAILDDYAKRVFDAQEENR